MAKILVINLGGSSSKLAIYENKECLAEKSLQHTQEEMAANPLSKAAGSLPVRTDPELDG